MYYVSNGHYPSTVENFDSNDIFLFIYWLGWIRKIYKINIEGTKIYKICIGRIWWTAVYDATRFLRFGGRTGAKTYVKILSFYCFSYPVLIVYFLQQARLKRRTLTLDDINKFKDFTPGLKKGSSQMFRTLRDKGIISYTEYLFLLSVLTSNSMFRIISNSNYKYIKDIS